MRFKPLTLRLLHEASVCFGGTIDDALEDPQRLLESEVSLQEAARFLRAVCEEEPDLMELPPEAAHATIAKAASGFFFQYVPSQMQEADRLMQPIWKRSGAPGGGGGTTFLRALAHEDFTEYQELLDAPVAESLVYLSLRAINAAYEKDRRR